MENVNNGLILSRRTESPSITKSKYYEYYQFFNPSFEERKPTSN